MQKDEEDVALMLSKRSNLNNQKREIILKQQIGDHMKDFIMRKKLKDTVKAISEVRNNRRAA